MFWLALLLLPGVLGGTELLRDPDFEHAASYSSGHQDRKWYCPFCTATISTDSYHGHRSIKVNHRSKQWAGLTQTFPVKSSHRYYFRAYMKLLNTDSGKMYEDVSAMIDITDTNGKHHHNAFGKTPHIQPGHWHIIGGDYKMPSFGIASARLYIQIHEADVDYLLDDATLQEVPTLTNFKTDADKRIDQLRKADINIRISDSNINPSGLTVQIHQTSSQFAWGSAVGASYMTDSQHKKYQDFFYDNFEWAVLENALKWRQMESHRGHMNFATPEKALSVLRSHGIKVRGHNIFWAGSKHVPSWQTNLDASDLRQEMTKRIQDTVTHFKGELLHWDVDNEALHGDFYEQVLKDPNITMWMFREVHKADPNPLLFLNEFHVVNDHSSTMAYEDQASYFKAAGVPVNRLGVQSHFAADVDISAIKFRLDEVARVGYKIWITELDINEADENKKADKYEDVLTLYFSHPAVEGVMFWGFSDQKHFRPTSALANGPDVTPNAAGRRYQKLVQQNWRTNESHPVTKGQVLKVRGFKGDYSVQVKHHGSVIKTETFTLAGSGADLTIHLSGSGIHPKVDNILVG